MKKVLFVGLKLALICAVSAVILAFVNSVTAPAIAEHKTAAVKEALSRIASGGETGEETIVNDNEAVAGYYPAKLPGKGDGYVLRLVGSGYGGPMQIMAGVTAGGEIYSVILMENQETPGLGKNAERPEYMKKFIGKGGADPVPVRKDHLPKAEADAVSGATITFLGVSKALAEGSRFVRGLGGER